MPLSGVTMVSRPTDPAKRSLTCLDSDVHFGGLRAKSTHNWDPTILARVPYGKISRVNCVKSEH